MAKRTTNRYMGKRNIDIEKLKASANQPPSSIETEMKYISSLILENTLIDKFDHNQLPGEFFFDKRHRIIMDGIIAMRNVGSSIDSITLYEYLKQEGKSDEAGGAEYILKLTQEGASYEGLVQNYYKIIYEKAVRRKMISTGMDMANSGYDPTTDTFEELNTHLVKISALNPKTPNSIIEFNQLSNIAEKEFEELIKRGGKPKISFGYKQMDRLTAGVHPGEMSVVCARSGIGKTTFALNLAQNLSEQGFYSAFFSYESNSSNLIYKLWSMQGINSDLFRYQEELVDTQTLKKMRDIISNSRGKRILINYERPNLNGIVANAISMKNLHPELGLVIFDNMQNFSAQKEYRNRKDVLKEIVDTLFNDVAKALGVHVVILAQADHYMDIPKINPYHIPSKATDVQDKESNIYEVADNFIFLWRPDNYFKDVKKAPKALQKVEYQNRIYLVPSKTRMALSSEQHIPLGFKGEYSRIYSLSDAEIERARVSNKLGEVYVDRDKALKA